MFETPRSTPALRLSAPTRRLAAALVAVAVAAATLTGLVAFGTFRAALPFDSPERLAMVWMSDAELTSRWLAPAETTELLDEHVFDDAAPIVDRVVTLTNEGRAIEANAIATTSGFFDILGERIPGAPVLGRYDAPHEDAILISERLWTTEFGRRAIDTLTIDVDGAAVRVAGVVPATFRFLPPSSVFPESVDVWMPFANAVDATQRSNRGMRYIHLLASVAPASLARVRTMLDARLARWRADHAADYATLRGPRLTLEPLVRSVTREIRPIVTSVTMAGLLLVFTALVAAQHFLLQSYRARRAHLGIALALGATPRRLGNEAARTALSITAAGTAIGLLATVAMAAWIPPIGDFRLQAALVSSPVLLMLYGASIAIALAFLLSAPAWLLIRRLPVAEAIGQQRGARAWTGNALLSGRSFVATLSLLLGASGVVGAAVLMQLARQERADLGFRADGVTAFRVNVSSAIVPSDADRIAVIDGILAAIESRAPRATAGAMTILPSGGGVRSTTLDVDGTQQPAAIRGITPGLFDTLAIAVERGAVPSRNVAGTVRYAVVDRALAQRIDPSGDVVGRTVRWVPGNLEFRIAAITRTAHFDGPNAEARGTVFLPLGPYAQRAFYILVRGVDARAARQLVADAVAGTGFVVPVSNAIDLRALVDGQYRSTRVGSTVITLYWLLLALISAIGYAAVASIWVTEHEHDVAVRRALGATSRDVCRYALRSWATPVALGGIAGLIVAAAMLERLGSATDATKSIAIAAPFAIAVATLAMARALRRVLDGEADARVLRA